MEDGWYVYPDSREPERRREASRYYTVFHHFKTYGEAWLFLIARFGRIFERYNSI